MRVWAGCMFLMQKSSFQVWVGSKIQIFGHLGSLNYAVLLNEIHCVPQQCTWPEFSTAAGLWALKCLSDARNPLLCYFEHSTDCSLRGITSSWEWSGSEWKVRMTDRRSAGTAWEFGLGPINWQQISADRTRGKWECSETALLGAKSLPQHGCMNGARDRRRQQRREKRRPVGQR